MDSVKPSVSELQTCMNDIKCIRNVCILAHVDHGKTTVADCLLATNRLVSKRLAGFVRYLDDRPDEQEKGITMKCSSVSLLNMIQEEDTKEWRKILLNLIDTPGHIDFSTEVEAALKVCDGAIILVDIVEGVCAQTRECIKQAYEENVEMILVLNKFDRLITELNQKPEDIFYSIVHVIENCNAIIAELYQYDSMNEIDIEDTGLLFDPQCGNVIFASAVDGWGFTLEQFAKLLIERFKEETVESLTKKLWNFDCYLNSKKEIQFDAIRKRKPNLFIQFVLKTVIHIYEVILSKGDVDDIMKRLKISEVTREHRHTDTKIQLRAILHSWKPLAVTILLQCYKHFNPPCNLSGNKLNNMLNISRFYEDPYLRKCIQDMIPLFNIEENKSLTTLSYVSKMFCVSKKNLSQNKPKIYVPGPRPSKEDLVKKQTEISTEEIPVEINEDVAVIALARVFSGRLTVGQEIYVMNSGYIPNEYNISKNAEEFVSNNKYIEKVVITELYMLFGRELLYVDSIPAGNFCGIGGLQSSVIRTATLSSNLNIVPFQERPAVEPVVRHAIEPVNPKDIQTLRQGLKFLMQSDSCVQVLVQETGEHVLLTAGDVHLAKCLEDLTKKFTNIEVNVSSPMVSLRETILECDLTKYVEIQTPYFEFSVAATALPQEILKTLVMNYALLRLLEDHQCRSLTDIIRQSLNESGNSNPEEKSFKSDTTNKNIKRLKVLLKGAFERTSGWLDYSGNIWSVSKIKDSLNLLVNAVDDYPQNIFVKLNGHDKRSLFDQCIVKAFRGICKAGPLCEEPLMNCAFIVKNFKLTHDIPVENISPQVTSTIEGMVRGAFKSAFEKQEQRLMEPMFTTSIQVNVNILGRVYTVVGKRHGKVLEAIGMDELERTLLVKAQIPVIESIGFANEIRSTTSGLAIPTLKFSHYEIIDGDPYYEPVENEDEDDEDINVDSGLRANKLRKDVRRRKGLHVDDQVVMHAEKQRTLKK